MSGAIDTLALAKRLQEHGFTQDQAEGLAEALFIQPAQLVTVPVLDQRLRELEQRLDLRFAGLDTRFAGLDTRFASLDTRFRDIEVQLQKLFVRLGGAIFGAVLLTSAIVHFWR